MVARALRVRDFNTTLRLPGVSPGGAETDLGITPSLLAGLLVRVTVWAGALCWLAQRHGRSDVAAAVWLLIGRTWAVATVLVCALALGRQAAQRLIACLPKPGPEGSSSRWNPAGAVGAAVYIVVVLLVLLIAADLFDWPLTRSSALALWQLAQHLLIACAALFIGCLGARWAQDFVTPEAAMSPEKRAGQYTALGVMAATTILAVAVLLSSAGVLIGLAALAILGLLLWLVRGYLPDFIAGLQLRTHGVREAWFDGVSWQLAEIGLLSTQLSRAGQFCSVQNRLVLEARLHGVPAQAETR
jgi:hypothetical protein